MWKPANGDGRLETEHFRIVYFEAEFSDEDATVVSRMGSAGAVLLGKTNTPKGGMSTRVENPVYGRTRNPLLPPSSTRDCSPV